MRSTSLMIVALALFAIGCGSPPAAPASDPVASPTPNPSPSESSPPTLRSETADEIDRLQAATEADPSDAAAHRDLGFALLQRVRETADPALYAPAEAAFERADRKSVV